MADGDATAAEATDPVPVSVTLEIVDGRTVIEVDGDRDAAVIVRSTSGERIYLPPEDFDRPPASARTTAYGSAEPDGAPGAADSPYQSPGPSDSPYQSPDADSPYQRVDGRYDSLGLEPTADGFRIVHPEPVTDFRLLR
jgi:hypothetical protein